jgi:NADPH-dependent glutamate synthase beta subunit-like oxidoreductase
MYCLESIEEMPVIEEDITEAVEEGISINNSWGVKRIVVESGKVKGVEFKKCVSVFDANKKFAPKYDENEVMTVEADYVLVTVGQSIDWGNLLAGTKVALNNGGTAVADALTLQTAQPEVFVGGDAFTGPSYAINAIVAGKQAAISMHRYVWPGQSLTNGRDRRVYTTIDKDNIVVPSFDNTPRQRIGHSNDGRKSFKDTRVTFTAEQLKKETARCLGCGTAVVDQNYCLGCGQCVVHCKMEAVKLIKKYDATGLYFDDAMIEVMKYAAERSVRLNKKQAEPAKAK